LQQKGADVIVVAAGAKIKTFHVPALIQFFTPDDIITKKRKPPQRIAIIGGSGVGLGIAVFLLRQDYYHITVIEEGSKLGRDVNPFYLWQYMGLMKKKKVIFMANSQLVGIDEAGLFISSADGEKTVDVEGIISAIREPVNEEDLSLEGLAGQVYYIGDAKRPRRLNNAIHDAHHTGMEV